MASSNRRVVLTKTVDSKDRHFTHIGFGLNHLQKVLTKVTVFMLTKVFLSSLFNRVRVKPNPYANAI